MNSNTNTNTYTTVNPNLAALMRVIEDHQDKMTEGDYLEAMNALCALHRQVPRPQIVPQYGQMPYTPVQPVQNRQPAQMFNTTPHLPEGMSGDEYRCWRRVSTRHPDPAQNRVSCHEWMQLPFEERLRMLREATEYLVKSEATSFDNPDPSVCPFIARHSVGPWEFGERYSSWTCVCGYKGFSRNWKSHEQGERHQAWAQTRLVNKRTVKRMQAQIVDDEAGVVTTFGGSNAQVYPGGIRTFKVRQERNEWTHPELYTPEHRQPVPATAVDSADAGTWFVHPRQNRANEYV